MHITQTLSEQGRNPTGALGRVLAWVMPVMFRSLYQKVARRLDLQRDDDVLDVACGSGTFLNRYASHVHRVAGVDHSALQIDMAQRSNRDRVAAGTAEFVRGETTALPWPDATFSAVTCNCVDCFAEPERSLQEMRRVLRPGGRAVLVMQGTDDEGRHRAGEVDRWGVPIRSETQVRQLMSDAGFGRVAVSFDHGAWFIEAHGQ